ncbi:hypothetical protein M1M94_01330 [Thermodesulfovibrionales bacterium]|nr:hypothetical protein [Thermodesulfovibrionales bacterium]
MESLDNGFKHITLMEFFDLVKNNNASRFKKYFIHRHDIDIDVKAAKKIFEIEKNHNIKSTYYFRLATLDIKLMQEINEFGSEASYHFEEIATYCKTNHIKTKQEVLENIDKAKEMFKKNIKAIEKKLGFKIESVASHGDFVNRKLKLINNEITKDMELRKELGIKVEAYDDIVMKNIDVYISDAPYPKFYSPVSPFSAIKEKNIICMLTHPENWHTCPVENTKNNFKRVWEGLVW